ncbi:MAG: DUF2391 family protein [Candidatus Aenigmarchaeota archaeon]|nr:DUF2391 family protein [Candidatus Aenigmarchaeota archaeon]
MVVALLRENGKSKISSLAHKIKPEKFGIDDVAQQIFGAVLFSAPLSVTEEVWRLAQSLSVTRMVVFVILSVVVATIIIYYTKFQRVAKESIGGDINTHLVGRMYVPKRLVSLFVIAYSVSVFILWLFGIMSYINDPFWTFKIFIFISFFASVGAATADIIK